MQINNQRNQSGFTLIEVIAALVLAGLAFAVLQGTLAQLVYTQKQLSGRTMAVVMGEGKLAELINESEPASSGEFPPPYARIKWSATEEETDTGTLITLTLDWKTGDAAFQKKFMGFRPKTDE